MFGPRLRIEVELIYSCETVKTNEDAPCNNPDCHDPCKITHLTPPLNRGRLTPLCHLPPIFFPPPFAQVSTGPARIARFSGSPKMRPPSPQSVRLAGAASALPLPNLRKAFINRIPSNLVSVYARLMLSRMPFRLLATDMLRRR